MNARQHLFLVLSGLLVPAIMLGTAGADRRAQPHAVEPIGFTRDIRPILAEHCYPCHGPDDKKRQAGLRLDNSNGATGLLPTGHRAIVPGKPDSSPLIIRVASGQMPPTGQKLTKSELATLRRWIAQGARYEEHWSFVVPKSPQIPPEIQNPKLALESRNRGSKIQNRAWCRNPIDNFVLDRLRKAGLHPSPDADRHTLIRRVSLDLTGLPPTPQEVESFVADASPDAYGRVVDRLLASPHFGEKWARMWLDLARYADSAGYGSDPLRTNIWPYRDWVINAFNRNLPYDQFTFAQLAGDLVADEIENERVREVGKQSIPRSLIASFPHSLTPTEWRIATAFNRNTMTNTEGGTDDEEFRTAAVKDRTFTTMQVWMGLTMQCAQCHTHKFDPIAQREFYSFMAYFNQTQDNDQPDESPTLPLMSDDQKKRIESLKTEIASLESKNDPKLKDEIARVKKDLDAIKPVPVPIMKEVATDKRRETHLLVLANFLQKGEKVEPGTPAFFHNLPTGAPANRLGVAMWLMSRDNPLTARVAVNRFWAQLFGRGIVETEEDFGHQGSLPTNQALLDWLAVQFRDGIRHSVVRVMDEHATPTNSWNVKALLKLIVTSATYRQSSRITPEALQKDPRNLLLSHYPRRRLDAETVRDQALALSGVLSHKIGGPSVYPPQPAGMWQAAFNGERTWATSTGEDRYRRGIYTFWRRTVPYPSMATFDAPSREICTIRRIQTNTPLQALVTLNDPVYLELAQALGRRIVREGGATTPDRIRFALRLATSHQPAEPQVRALGDLYERELARYKADPDSAKKLATEPLGPLPAGTDVSEQAAWTVVANVLLNLDSVLTNG